MYRAVTSSEIYAIRQLDSTKDWQWIGTNRVDCGILFWASYWSSNLKWHCTAPPFILGGFSNIAVWNGWTCIAAYTSEIWSTSIHLRGLRAGLGEKGWPAKERRLWRSQRRQRSCSLPRGISKWNIRFETERLHFHTKRKSYIFVCAQWMFWFDFCHSNSEDVPLHISLSRISYGLFLVFIDWIKKWQESTKDSGKAFLCIIRGSHSVKFSVKRFLLPSLPSKEKQLLWFSETMIFWAVWKWSSSLLSPSNRTVFGS